MIYDISTKLVSFPQTVKPEAVNTKPLKVEPEKIDSVSELSTAGGEIPEDKTSKAINEVNAEIFSNIVNDLNSLVQNIQRELNFRVDEGSGETVVTVLDSKTDEVIRQIPADHVLAISENIESLKGILFSAEV